MGKKVSKVINDICEGILAIIYPRENYCILCNREDYMGICDICKEKIKKVNNYLDGEIISYGYYGGTLKELILKFKYKRNFTAGDILSELLEECLIKNINYKEYVITYIPISKSSKKIRGFNQCEYLAKKLSKALFIDCLEVLVKVKETKEQKTLKKQERAENIRDAFNIKKGVNVTNIKFILIDDVATTGYTLQEGYNLLKKYGAKEIKLLTLAKSHI
ncbi:ComF family protein [Clostridium uliginosum]|uniref:Competence protein ComFC n=1 Tax=Clostridium uliginosum TaxID=119641 RepID=A0A1I1I8Y4_9CLOT|nr:phosphoribosyltransferase family protein [Clostridium uliginosum]SFC32495.1 competence protein ComFC [Clostridium uliginosum]